MDILPALLLTQRYSNPVGIPSYTFVNPGIGSHALVHALRALPSNGLKWASELQNGALLCNYQHRKLYHPYGRMNRSQGQCYTFISKLLGEHSKKKKKGTWNGPIE